MSPEPQVPDQLRPEDLSRLSPDEIYELRDAIMERARRTVDPAGTGFDALMMSTDDSSFFTTDDVTFADWLDWVERIITVIYDSASRIGMAVISAGGAVAASLMYGTPGGSRWAGVTLAASAAFGVWFIASAAMARMRSR